MKARNFANLGGSSAAALNAGTIGIQKDKVVHLDPTTEILYDSAENIRNGQVVDDSVEGLIALRLTMDGAEQLQPIRVFPLPPEKLDPANPAMKYGIAYGHRRTLSCRLTSADHPSIGPQPRKVAAVIDVDWLKRGRAYRLRCQIHENTAKVDLNPVELGQALLEYQREVSLEEKRHVSQKELMQVYDLREKTVYNLLKAAEFHPVAKSVCHSHLLSDLDTMVTFDSICKLNEELATAIFESLKVPGAPNNRSLIRQARVLAEDESYKFNPESWVWPDSVAVTIEKQAPQQDANPVAVLAKPQVATGVEAQEGGASTQQQSTANRDDESSNERSGSASNEQEKVELGGGESATERTNSAQVKGDLPPSSAGAVAGAASADPAGGSQDQAPGAQPSVKATDAPIIMVEFKMGVEAKVTFTGELLVSRKAKATSAGVVAYLNEEGREETIEVPLAHIALVSINHA